MLIGAMLSALIACGDETAETYARLAAHSNMWESSNFNEDYHFMVVHDLIRLKKTDAIRHLLVLAFGQPSIVETDVLILRKWPNFLHLGRAVDQSHGQSRTNSKANSAIRPEYIFVILTRNFQSMHPEHPAFANLDGLRRYRRTEFPLVE